MDESEPKGVDAPPERNPVEVKLPSSLEELQQMETMGMISLVDVPILWCAGMVIAPKKSGSARIIINLKQLNQNML